MPDQEVTFTFSKSEKERLDSFLTSLMENYSRSRIQGMIKEGFVKVNGKVINKPGFALESGERIKVHVPAIKPSPLTPEKIDLDIIFENNDLLVVNKPAGMVVHPSPGHNHGTLVHAILGYNPNLEGIGGEERPGIIHRLDKDTSGLIVVAKNEPTHRWLQDQFRQRLVKKTYIALVDGKPPTPIGRIEAPIGRHTSQRKLMAVVPVEKGRDAISNYRTLTDFTSHTLLEINPQTGRTHQIRVHLAFIGCPITGDTVYGKRKPTLMIQRQFLHAEKLELRLPNEKTTNTFFAPLPNELIKVLEILQERL